MNKDTVNIPMSEAERKAFSNKKKEILDKIERGEWWPFDRVDPKILKVPAKGKLKPTELEDEEALF